MRIRVEDWTRNTGSILHRVSLFSISIPFYSTLLLTSCSERTRGMSIPITVLGRKRPRTDIQYSTRLSLPPLNLLRSLYPTTSLIRLCQLGKCKSPSLHLSYISPSSFRYRLPREADDPLVPALTPFEPPFPLTPFGN
jgi:hypothetical protein